MSAKIIFILCSYIFSVIFAQPNLNNFLTANNYFTASVYNEIRKSYDENFVVSPFSVNMILSLIATGARGQTSLEIFQALQHPSHHRLYEELAQLSNIRNANKVYIKNSYTINRNFTQIAQKVFKSNAESIDFSLPSEAANIINKWVQQKTNNKIKYLIHADDLSSKTRAILVNALYFQANWSNPFESFLTKKQDFFHPSGPISVDTMKTFNTEFKYFEDLELDAKFLEMPCESDEASMVIVLPNNINGLSHLESNIQTVLNRRQFDTESVNVVIPKFKVENHLDLKEVLERLGVKSIFKPSTADLSGIAGKPGDLIVNKVIQKSFIDVNEEGVEAAAATYVDAIIPLSGHFPMKPSKEFNANHPFIFYIKVRNVVIFIGKITRPQ